MRVTCCTIWLKQSEKDIVKHGAVDASPDASLLGTDAQRQIVFGFTLTRSCHACQAEAGLGCGCVAVMRKNGARSNMKQHQAASSNRALVPAILQSLDASCSMLCGQAPLGREALPWVQRQCVQMQDQCSCEIHKPESQNISDAERPSCPTR